jgi:hypothetical protein
MDDDEGDYKEGRVVSSISLIVVEYIEVVAILYYYLEV